MSSTPSCPNCGSGMQMRRSAKGYFWGCTQYPRCRGIVDAGNAAPVSGGGAGARLKSRYAGRCDNCRSDIAVGDPILYSDRRVVGCMACRPADVEPAKVTGNTVLPSKTPMAWDGLIDDPAAAVLEPPLVMPPTVNECIAITLPKIQLDEHQMRVVNWRKGEAVAAAGAGSGKSTTLLERLAALVREGCPPERIITLVYNKKAADDFKGRVIDRMGAWLGSRVAVLTFHAWAYSLINEWWPGRFGRGRIVGTEDGTSAITLGLYAFKAAGLSEDNFEVKSLLKFSELAREALINLDEPEAAEKVQRLPTNPDEGTARAIVRFARAYQAEKAKKSLIDFADMLYIVNRVIDHDGVRARMLAQKYTHVQVDEAQDVNPARLRIAVHLATGANSLVWCGDFRQTIYGFTGSRPDLLRERMDEGAELLPIPVNRRSTQKIVEAGNKIARDHDWNVGGDTQPAPENTREDAEDVRIWWTESSGDEADMVAAEVQARIEDGLPLADEHGRAHYAALVRTNGQAADLEIAFTMRKLPCRVLGSAGGVWASHTGRDFLAYLRAGAGTPDRDLTRVANKPRRFVRRSVVEDAVQSPDPIEYLRQQYQNRGATNLAQDLVFLQQCDWGQRCDETLRFLIKDLKDRADDVEDAITPDEDKAEAYRALCMMAKELGSVEAIDAQVQLMKQVGQKDPAVEICTMHRSKGAEWEVVFVCGLAAGLVPHYKAHDEQEERRLFYVAMTRAKHVAFLSVGGRKPSKFLRAVLEDDSYFPEDTLEGPPPVNTVKAVPPIIRKKVPPEAQQLLHGLRVLSSEEDALNDMPADQRDETLKAATREAVDEFIEKYRTGRITFTSQE